jgi:hypothetical protein
VFLLLATMITVATLSSRLILREPGPRRRPAAEAGHILRRTPSILRRIPRAAWSCALIACLNAACWSVITPPFQAPDEPSHFAYVQHLVETRTLPVPGKPGYSEEEAVALRDLQLFEVRFIRKSAPSLRSPSSDACNTTSPRRFFGGPGQGALAALPPTHRSTTRSRRSPIGLARAARCSTA